MIGSAAQNVIALSDSVFLYHLSQTDFAAIGFVGVFYLIIASIGYGFSRGGQIIMARRYGESNFEETGKNFYALLYFELALAVLMFLFIQFGTPWFFKLFIGNEAIYTKSLEYIMPRSFGVFFAYTGVAIIALYTGIARTKFIIIDTLVLAGVNIVLNYALIFGKFGLPSMGIAGAGWASTIAEMCAAGMFLIYMIFDKEIRKLRLRRFLKINFILIKQVFNISSPIVLQAVVGLGSWFLFFSMVENMGERPLAITNLGRLVYLVLSIPCWGYAAGINTLVSNFIGRDKKAAVIPLVWKTAKINLANTLLLAIPIIVLPKFFLYPLFGGTDMSLIEDARPVLMVMLLILTVFSIGATFFNGIIGTGATYYGLKIQTLATAVYLGYIYLVINVFKANLEVAWAAEIIYWLIILIFSIFFLKSKNWYFLKI
jgi:putative MATE family efflux protein